MLPPFFFARSSYKEKVPRYLPRSRGRRRKAPNEAPASPPLAGEVPRRGDRGAIERQHPLPVSLRSTTPPQGEAGIEKQKKRGLREALRKEVSPSNLNMR